MAQVNVLELETRVLLDEDLHTTIEEFQKRVQAQRVEIIMDSLLPVSFLIPFSFSSQGNVESFMGSWFLDWMFTTNKQLFKESLISSSLPFTNRKQTP
jgi:hypothetical protein